MNVQPNTWLKLFSSLNYGVKLNLVDQISLYFVHLYKTCYDSTSIYET